MSVVVWLLVVTSAIAAEKPRRARPPEWPAEVVDVFFADAREHLVGVRPDYEHLGQLAAQKQPIHETAVAEQTPGVGSAQKWSELIDAEAIETEVKRIATWLDRDVPSAGVFKSGGYRRARAHFSELAALFAVIGQYDGRVRWQDSAAELRDAFAQAGYNTRAGTDAVFAEVTARKTDLADLIRGMRPVLPAAEATVDWSRVADRGPLMKRMNQAYQQEITGQLSDEATFLENADEVRHAAQVLAMLANVIGSEGFDYWDEEEYATYAAELREAAGEIAVAAATENYALAQQAFGRAGTACNNCHDGYR